MEILPTAEVTQLMCGSRKYPDPHHEGNWKFQVGGGGGGGFGQLNTFPQG